jgi:hypothetical protein
MWVLAWVCLRYKDGKLRISDRPLDAWATNEAQTVCEKKTYFLHNFFELKPLDVDQLIWRLVAECFLELGEQARRRTVVMVNISARTEETAKSSKGTPAEEIELADKVLLDRFTNAMTWVELHKSL